MGLSHKNDQGVYRNRNRMIVDNFLGGMAWSFGTLVGGAIVLIIAGIILSKVNLIPFVGQWVGEVLQTAINREEHTKSQIQTTIRQAP